MITLKLSLRKPKGQEYLNQLKTEIGNELLPAIGKCIHNLDRTAKDIHLSSFTEKQAKFGGSTAVVVGTGLILFPPTSLLGATLLGAGAFTGIGSWVGGWAHQKCLYNQGMKEVEATLQNRLTLALDQVTDVLEKLQGMENDEDISAAQIEEVQILYVMLRHVAFMWDSSGDDREKKTWSEYLGLGSTAASGTGLTGLGVKSTILTGKAWKVAKARVVKDAVEAWKAARAAGHMTHAATKAGVVKNAVDGLKAARSASLVASRALTGLGVGLGIVAFVWDSYELHADNPTEMENECRARAEQLGQLEGYLAEFSGHKPVRPVLPDQMSVPSE